MNIRQTLVDAYKKNYKSKTNTYVDLTTSGNMILWSDDPEYKDTVFPAYVDGKRLEFNDNFNDNKDIIDKYKFSTYLTHGKSPYRLIAIPQNAKVQVAMDVEHAVNDLNEDSVIESTAIKYNNVVAYYHGLDEKILAAYFS